MTTKQKSTWTISPEMAGKLTTLADDLSAEIYALRDRWADESEEWQESRQGVEIQDYMEDLELVVEAMNTLES